MHPYAAAGWDQALNHAALVVLDEQGEILGWWCVCQKAIEAKRAKGHGIQIPPKVYKLEDQHQRQQARLLALRDLYEVLLDKLREVAPAREVYLSVEDYALGKASGAHQMGEAGGALRCAVVERTKLYTRLHDPMSVKLWATGKGNADKDEVGAAMVRRWGPFPWAGLGLTGDTPGDLHDAYALARMARQEHLLRAGVIGLEELDDQERRVWLRVTRTHPVGALDRPYLGIGLYREAGLRG